MKFTPDWILKLTCGCAAINFVMGQLPLRSYINRYAKDLLLTYEDAKGEKIEQSKKNKVNKDELDGGES